jgi:hypothetical protein
MRYINLFEDFEARGVYNVHRRNRIDVEKNLSYGGWNIKYSSKNGKGRALIFDNKSKMTSDMNLSSNEMFLFGIETTPSNSGIGRMLLKDIFDYFDIDTIYLPSMDNHPVWNKIATKTNKSKGGMSIFKIKKEDL